jgi:predicted nucleotidyltransferase
MVGPVSQTVGVSTSRGHNRDCRPSGRSRRPREPLQRIARSRTKQARARSRFGVVRLALLGSTVRDAAGPISDIDILVYFDGPATSERYFGVQFFLENLLGHPIDLVTARCYGQNSARTSNWKPCMSDDEGFLHAASSPISTSNLLSTASTNRVDCGTAS